MTIGRGRLIVTMVLLLVAAMARGADVARGKTLFFEHGCYSCHGYGGQTGARDLVGTGSPLVTDESTFITFLRLRANEAPLLPSTRMPNFPVEAVSDAQARDIFAFINTLRLDTPEIDQEPAMKAILDSAGREYRK
ncbi:MAG: cytochrome c [Gammaproteobacteria bacterium]|nr:cytochrome c [Gammaproteobacteria bacterium]